MKIIFSLFLIFPFVLFSQEIQDHKNTTEETVDTLFKNATFPGGVGSMMKYLSENIEYPEIALELGDQGKVILEFVVNKDGSIEQVNVLKGVSPEIDREAKRVVSNMPNWIPAESKGELVRARCRIPINFMFKEDVKLNVRNVKDLFKSNIKWYSPNIDSTYFKNDTLFLETDLGHIKIKTSKNIFVWSILDKRKLGFYNFNLESGVSSPMKIGYKYKIEEVKGELYITIKRKGSITDQFRILKISQYSNNNKNRIEMKRETP